MLQVVLPTALSETFRVMRRCINFIDASPAASHTSRHAPRKRGGFLSLNTGDDNNAQYLAYGIETQDRSKVQVLPILDRSAGPRYYLCCQSHSLHVVSVSVHRHSSPIHPLISKHKHLCADKLISVCHSASMITTVSFISHLAHHIDACKPVQSLVRLCDSLLNVLQNQILC